MKERFTILETKDNETLIQDNTGGEALDALILLCAKSGITVCTEYE